VVLSFIAEDGAVQVRDAVELEEALAGLLPEGSRREQSGRNALTVVHENIGAIERTAEMIVRHLEDGELYVAPRR